MNYGYADGDPVQLEDADCGNRYPLQLYHYTCAQVPLEGKKVLEVGCGRGGGADYVARYFNPVAMTGLDISGKAVDFCDEKYRNNPLLSFKNGDALELERIFAPAGFDVVINVESSHRYKDFPAFLQGVYTVLTPGGHFILTDFRYTNEWPEVKTQINNSSFELVREENITANVVQALDLDSDRREKLITSLTPGFLHNTAREFAGTKGTSLYNSFVDGGRKYFCLVLKKPL